MVAVIEQHLIVINKNFGAEKSTQRRVILLSFPLSSRKNKKSSGELQTCSVDCDAVGIGLQEAYLS